MKRDIKKRKYKKKFSCMRSTGNQVIQKENSMICIHINFDKCVWSTVNNSKWCYQLSSLASLVKWFLCTALLLLYCFYLYTNSSGYLKKVATVLNLLQWKAMVVFGKHFRCSRGSIYFICVVYPSIDFIFQTIAFGTLNALVGLPSCFPEEWKYIKKSLSTPN